MSAPCKSACSAWAEIEDVLSCGCSSLSPVPSDEDVEAAIAIATDTLFELSGRQFAGSCLDVVRPCSRRYYDDRLLASWDADWGRLLVGCGCARSDMCSCSSLSQIKLGGYPLTGIQQVKVDGAVLDPSLYRIDDYRWLVRLPDSDGTNPGWPCCQDLNLPSTQADTFEVTFVYGSAPPPLGVRAASELACQLLRSCSSGGAGCQLPERVTSVTRQGLTMVVLDPFDFLDRGRTGLYAVDLFLATYNPSGVRKHAAVLSPDSARSVRRVGT